MSPEEQYVRTKASSMGVDPDVAVSVWQQEGSKTTDTSLRGQPLSRNRGQAVGPWQVVPYYHPEFPISGSFEEQTDYALGYLREAGLEGYYGRGTPPPGHPTTEEYVNQVMGRVPQQGAAQQAGGQQPASYTDLISRGLSHDQAVAWLARNPPAPTPAAGTPPGVNPMAMLQQMMGGQMQGQQQPPSGAEALFTNPWMVAGAATMGGPIGAGVMAASEAVRQSQKLDQQINQKMQLPENIKEIAILKAMYPNLSDEEVLSMAFTGRVPPGGETVKDVGGRIYETRHDPMGRPYMAPLQEGDQRGYENVLTSQERAKTVGEKYGQEQVSTVKTLSDNFGKVSEQLSRTQLLRKEFESGKYKGDTGAIRGRIKQFFDPDTAVIKMQEMQSTLENLGVQNLAPVSNYEIDLLRSMSSGILLNEEQNVAVLKKLEDIQSAKKSALRRAMDRLKKESIEDYMLDPETVEYYDFDLNPGGAGGAAPGPAGGAAPVTDGSPAYDPAGINAEIDQLLNPSAGGSSIFGRL